MPVIKVFLHVISDSISFCCGSLLFLRGYFLSHVKIKSKGANNFVVDVETMTERNITPSKSHFVDPPVLLTKVNIDMDSQILLTRYLCWYLPSHIVIYKICAYFLHSVMPEYILFVHVQYCNFHHYEHISAMCRVCAIHCSRGDISNSQCNNVARS